MGCAASSPLEEGLTPTVPKKEAQALAKKALASPPFPSGHGFTSLGNLTSVAVGKFSMDTNLI